MAVIELLVVSRARSNALTRAEKSPETAPVASGVPGHKRSECVFDVAFSPDAFSVAKPVVGRGEKLWRRIDPPTMPRGSWAI